MSTQPWTARWVYDDGGRAAAGYRVSDHDAGDCACRALAIAGDLPYEAVYTAIAARNADKGERKSARGGVRRDVMRGILLDLGWHYTATMGIGTGCTVHLREDELPSGRLIVQVSKHWCAVIDGVIHDTFDPSRDGTRCVYGYWTSAER